MLATEPMFVQLDPPLVEYCQVPLPLLNAVIAIPSIDPLSASVIRSPPADAIIAATVLPEFVVSSSVIVVNDMLPVLSSTGASLRLVTVIEAVALLFENAVVPPAVVVSI